MSDDISWSTDGPVTPLYAIVGPIIIDLRKRTMVVSYIDEEEDEYWDLCLAHYEIRSRLGQHLTPTGEVLDPEDVCLDCLHEEALEEGELDKEEE